MGALTIRLTAVRPRNAWKAYEKALERRPLATKVATSIVGFTLGDMLCQIINRPSSANWQYDIGRTARMATFGGVVGGPIGHYWFNFLDKVHMCGHTSTCSLVISIVWSMVLFVIVFLCAVCDAKKSDKVIILSHIFWLMLCMAHSTFIIHFLSYSTDTCVYWRSPSAIAAKIVLDQTINAPLGTALFFITTRTLEGHPQEITHDIQVCIEWFL
jgi:hypothetical protein